MTGGYLEPGCGTRPIHMASSGPPCPGPGLWLPRQAELRCLLGWQSYPPATSSTEAPQSPAQATASSVESVASPAANPGSLPRPGEAQSWPKPQPLPSLMAPQAPLSKSGVDVESQPGARLQLGAGKIGVGLFLPCSSLPWLLLYQDEPPMLCKGQGLVSKASAFWAHRLALWCPTQHLVCAMPPWGAGYVLSPCTSFPVPAAAAALPCTARAGGGVRAAAGQGITLPTLLPYHPQHICSLLSCPNLWMLLCHAGG